jgi:hypothetical protein
MIFVFPVQLYLVGWLNIVKYYQKLFLCDILLWQIIYVALEPHILYCFVHLVLM